MDELGAHEDPQPWRTFLFRGVTLVAVPSNKHDTITGCNACYRYSTQNTVGRDEISCLDLPLCSQKIFKTPDMLTEEETAHAVAERMNQ